MTLGRNASFCLTVWPLKNHYLGLLRKSGCNKYMHFHSSLCDGWCTHRRKPEENEGFGGNREENQRIWWKQRRKPEEKGGAGGSCLQIAMGWGNFLKAVLSNIDIFAGPVVTLLYPLYSSIRAIESPSRLDDQQWLTYWVLYSFITLFELTFSRMLQWLPFWPYVKLIATCWLVLPVFNGAAYVYENFVRTYLLNSSVMNSSARSSPGQRILNAISPSTKNSVERFVNQYGPDALDRAIKRAEKEAKVNRNAGYDDEY